MTIAICDTELAIAKYIHEMTDVFLKQNNVSESLKEPVKIIKFNKPNLDEEVDILVINTQLADVSGISAAKQYKMNKPSCQIIFYSKVIDDSLKVYEVEHVYFVLLSNIELYLGKALNNAVELYAGRRKQFLFIKMGSARYRILIKDILYIEVKGRYVNIFTEEKHYVCISRLKEMIDLLPDNFVRSHNSYLVNIDKVSKIQNNECILPGDYYVPISYTYRKNFLKKMNNIF